MCSNNTPDLNTWLYPPMDLPCNNVPGIVKHTDEITSYFTKKFASLWDGQSEHVAFSKSWDFTFLQECDQIICVLYAAHNNRGIALLSFI